MNKKGFVMGFVIAISVALSIITAVLVLSAECRNRFAAKYVNSQKAYYLAVSGIEYFKYAMEKGEIELSINDTPVNINIDAPVALSRFDINRDGIQDINDCWPMIRYAGVRRGSWKYDIRHDINRDGRITLGKDIDVIVTAQKVNEGPPVPDIYTVTVQCSATINGSEGTVKMELYNNKFSRTYLYRDPVVRWE